jgi:hypothetical protein
MKVDYISQLKNSHCSAAPVGPGVNDIGRAFPAAEWNMGMTKHNYVNTIKMTLHKFFQSKGRASSVHDPYSFP